MSRVFVHAVKDHHAEVARERLVACAQQSTSLEHQLVDRADDADLILIMAAPDGDPSLSLVRQDQLYRQERGRCLVYCEHDNAVTLLPGIYVGAPERWMSPGWTRSGPYFGKMRASELPADGINEPIQYLYSFVGSVYTHPIRERLVKLTDDRALLTDSGDRATSHRLTFDAPEADRYERRRSYDEALARSAFVLCPRGVSPGSIRFFESLRAGRVPVVVSDDWVLPEGPDWSSFIVRVPENNLEEIPQILRGFESEATDRGLLARQTWEQWFDEKAILDRFVNWASEIQQRRSDSFAARIWRSRILFSREHLRTTGRSLVRRGRI